jgi:hypothetical protein
MENENIEKDEDAKEYDFRMLIDRLQNSGDLELLLEYFEGERELCKYARYDEEVYKDPYKLAFQNGCESAHDRFLTLVKNALT